jgi:hypothetical protein
MVGCGRLVAPMNARVLSKLRERLQPALDRRAPVGILTDAQHEVIYALLQVLAGDTSFPRADVRAYVDERTSTVPGYLREYQTAVELLSAATARRHPGTAFPALSVAARDEVLRSFLRRYPSPRGQPAWRRRLRLTSENVDTLVAGGQARRFRLYVARDLLAFYFSSAAGWAVVGYQAFPGRSRAELEPCEVRSVAIEQGQVILALSDGSFEPLETRALRAEGNADLSVMVKSGRQRASFSRVALLALGEHVEEADGALVLRIGPRTYEIVR